MSSRSATALDNCGWISTISEIGEPPDQVDVVDREVDDHADVRHPWREWPDPGDGDRKDVLILDRPLDRLHRRIEALDMADHERHTGAAGGRDDGVALLDRWSDRFLDHDMNAARNALQREVVMQMRRRRDCNRVDAGPQQSVDVIQCGTAEVSRHDVALLAVRVGDSNEVHARNIRQHTSMIAAHDADANDANLQRIGRYPDCLTHVTQKTPLHAPPRHFPSTA